MDDPIPDELCSHVQVGAEMTGGWLFLGDEPKAVGMCHECIEWCRAHFLTDQMPMGQYDMISRGRLLGE